MAISLPTFGTLTTTTTASAYNLVSATAEGVYVFQISTRNMTASATGDWLELRVFGQITSTTTAELIDTYTAVGAQNQDYLRTQPYVTPHYFAVQVFHRQFALGSGTDFIWSVYRVT